MFITAGADREINSIDVRKDRVETILQRYYNSEVRICAERTHLATQAWKETEGQPLDLRRAKLFAKICDEIPITIFEHELIVGSPTTHIRGTAPQLDYNSQIGQELVAGDRATRGESKALISPEDLDMVTEDTNYWKGKSPGEQVNATVREAMGSLAEEVLFAISRRGVADMMKNNRHIEYRKVLRLGLKGMLAEIEQEMAEIDFTSYGAIKKYQYLRAAKICFQAFIRYAKRYAELARQMAAQEGDAKRKEELEAIAAICDHVPENPPRNFWEALQAVRLIYIGVYLEIGFHSILLGRIDQYLYPFYKEDIETGRLTREQAAELLACFSIKFAEMEGYKTSWRKVQASGSQYNKIVLGGVDREGNDASNELTYLFLHVYGHLRILQPLFLRWHSGTPRELMAKAVWTNKMTGSEPAFHNDEQAIPLLIEAGISLEDARDYFIHGCAHPFVPGASAGKTGAASINGAKVFELVMKNGYDSITAKKQIGLQTGDPRQFSSIQDWTDAFFKQWEYIYDIIVKTQNITHLSQLEVYSQPFTTALVAEDSIRQLQLVSPGDHYLQFGSNIFNRIYADVADSLIAIKKVVYEQQKFTVDQVLEACASNFEGENGEFIRDTLKAAPKYGNDLGEPEEMYRLLSDGTNAIIRSRKNYAGYPMRDLRNGASEHLSHGRITGALPNGRKTGMPLADGGISPCAGCDLKGPTTTFRSVAKAADFKKINSAVLNQKIPKGLLNTDEHVDQFIALIETYFQDYNGYQVQWNIENKEVYLAAKENPSEHKDLVVRVGGYSAYFIELDPKLQDEIIARTEQFV